MSPRNASTVISLHTTTHRHPPEGWNEFVAEAPGGTFCHLGGWKDIMTDVLGHECLYVTARDESGDLQGALPLVAVRSRLFGHYLVSVPFLNYGGPVGSEEGRRVLTEWAGQEAERRDVDLLELRWREAALAPDPGAIDEVIEDSIDLPKGFRETRRKVTVLLPLPDDSETLWSDGLRAKVRSQVRRPMKEGYETRFGAVEVEPFYEVFERNMRDLGTPVLPLSLFKRLPALFGDDVTFAAVYDGERPIAAGCGFHFNGEFELTWASSLRDYNRSAPNMLLYWNLMENAVRRGDTVFNFGRCTPGGGTHRFKSQWGGDDEPLPWVVWSPSGEAATPNPDQAKYRLATTVWSKLPLPVARVFGPPLARRIP